jgi:hypothetical protein
MEGDAVADFSRVRVTRSWERLPEYKARAMVYSALRTMSKSAGGPFTKREISEIIQDVMELPTAECNIAAWDKKRCRVLIVRLLARGLIYDPRI